MKSIKKDYLMIVLFFLVTLFILFAIFYYSGVTKGRMLPFQTITHNNISLQEKFGKYCGSYNLDSNSETACKSDNECAWNKYVPKKGDPTGWCGLNPEPSHPKYENEDDDVQKPIDDSNNDYDNANN
jgi:hypothetical protein